jgi:hypothetical protein
LRVPLARQLKVRDRLEERVAFAEEGAGVRPRWISDLMRDREATQASLLEEPY